MDQAQIVLYVTKELTAFRRDLVRDVIIPMEQRIVECCKSKSKSKSKSRSRKKPVPTAPAMALNRKQGSFVGARPASKGPFSSPRRKKKTAKKTISVSFKGGKRRTRRSRRSKRSRRTRRT
jgi:hypothetical protein